MKLRAVVITSILVHATRTHADETVHLGGNADYVLTYSSLQPSLTNPNDALGLRELDHSIEAVPRIRVGSIGGSHLAGQIWLKVDPIEPEFDITIEQAYLHIEAIENVSLRVGQQRIRWGTGFLWNPTDRLNARKDMTDFQRHLLGIMALRAEVTLGDASITFVIAPDVGGQDHDTMEKEPPRVARSAVGLEVYFLLWDTDIYLSASTRRGDGDLSDAVTDYARQFETSLGLAVARELLGTVFTVEAALNTTGGKKYFNAIDSTDAPRSPAHYYKNDWVPSIAVGFNRKMGAHLVVGEYFHNGLGYDGDDWSGFTSTLENAEAGFASSDPAVTTAAQSAFANAMSEFRPAELRKNYAFIFYKYKHEELFGFGTSVIFGLDDASVLIKPAIDVTGIPNVSLTLEATLFAGNNSEAEFRVMPFSHSVSVRSTLYY